MSTENTLYGRLGGRDGITTVVEEFYDRVLSDDLLAGFFEEMDMTAQRAHMTQFLSAVAGGPVEYTGAEMRAVHEPLDLRQEHFDAVAGHLEDALRDCDVSEAEIEDVMAEVVALEDDVLCR